MWRAATRYVLVDRGGFAIRSKREGFVIVTR
jgi:hypothetical protein